MSVHTFPRGSIKAEQVYRIQYPDGSGDVVLRQGNEFEGPIGLTGVADVRRVEELVRRLLVNTDPESA